MKWFWPLKVLKYVNLDDWWARHCLGWERDNDWGVHYHDKSGGVHRPSDWGRKSDLVMSRTTKEQAEKIKQAWRRTIYTFHRTDGFYPIRLNSDEDARRNALANPGTLKVVNERTGEIVWPL